MTRRQKPKPRKPDEVFGNELFSVARFGKNLVWESNLTEESHAEYLKRCKELYPEIVSEIDRLVAAIAKQVSQLPPEALLRIAWWEMGFRHIHIEAEAEVTIDDAVSMRMIDYVQSVIASVKPDDNPKTEVSKEDWNALRNNVEKLFATLNMAYQVCRTAKAKSEDPDYNEDAEEFFYRAQYYWCNVRGNRYQVHVEAYLRDVFIPHSAVLKKLFGISAEKFIKELMKIWRSLTFGISQVGEQVELFQKNTLTALNAKIAQNSPDENVDISKLMNEVIVENGWEERRDKVFGLFAGSDLYNVRKLTELPKELVDELSWGQGEDTDFFAEGEFKGWPLRIWPIFKRPFIQITGQYYCFDLHALFDNIYRVMQRIILRIEPDYLETWNKTQQKLSEDLPFKYLKAILQGAKVYESVYYKWLPKESSTRKERCEVDGLLAYDDHLFIVECKGGAFAYTPPATDFPAFVASLENLVLKPATQGKRFLDYLQSADSVSVFDKDYNQICELHKSDFRHISICPVTLDPFTEMAAQVQHLRKIGIEVGSHPIWVTSVDNLRVYADIFENPLHFLHYAEQRNEAFKSDIIQVDDELDHLGLYLKHNHYSTHIAKIRGNSDVRINFAGCRAKIDKFFLERMRDPKYPNSLKQDTPSRLVEIVDWLATSSKAGRAKMASYLLDLCGDERNRMAEYIDNELELQPRIRRPKPCSSHGGNIISYTIFCYTDKWAPRNTEIALSHTKEVMFLAKETERLLLELSYAGNGDLQDVEWKWVNTSSISSAELASLEVKAEELRRTKIKSAKSTRGKIGRNDPCPCGSGKKYKRCCLDR